MGRMLRRRWRSLGAVLGISLGLGLLLALLGPLVDHHYAERLPSHIHWYLAGQPRAHPHPYESIHHHEPSDSVGTSEGIVFVPTLNAGLSGFPALELTLLSSALLIALFLSAFVLSLRPRAVFKPAFLRVSPPPPRVLPSLD